MKAEKKALKLKIETTLLDIAAGDISKKTQKAIGKIAEKLSSSILDDKKDAKKKAEKEAKKKEKKAAKAAKELAKKQKKNKIEQKTEVVKVAEIPKEISKPEPKTVRVKPAPKTNLSTKTTGK